MSTETATNTDYTGQEIHVTAQPTFTDGVSPKAVLAFLFPLIAALITALISWIVSGEFNTSEIKVAATGVGTSLIAALGAYVGSPGRQLPAPTPIASDALIPDGAHALIAKSVEETPVDDHPIVGD